MDNEDLVAVIDNQSQANNSLSASNMASINSNTKLLVSNQSSLLFPNEGSFSAVGAKKSST